MADYQRDRFGQCAPSDATRRERIEAAASLLCLRDPNNLESALFDAGLHLVTDADKRVLDEMSKIEQGVLEAIRDKWSCAPPIFHPPCLAELARRGEKA